jgi:hypothetical protein
VVHLNNEDVDLSLGVDFNLSLGNSKSIDGPSLKFDNFNSYPGNHLLPEYSDLGDGIILKLVNGGLKILSPLDGDLLDLGLPFDSNGGDDGEGRFLDFLGDSENSVSPGDSVGVDGPNSIALDEGDLLFDEESVVNSDSGDDDSGSCDPEVLVFKGKSFSVFLGFSNKLQSVGVNLVSGINSKSFDSSVNLNSDFNADGVDSFVTTSLLPQNHRQLEGSW